jgi:cytochrome d ubiquinol oxidase subunit II
MIAIWYGIISFLLITYLVLDGRNFGAGMLHGLVAKTREERRQVMAALGPRNSWDEVWLVGFAGTLLAVFPRLTASAFSGYYMPLFMILWCLVFRGIALEARGHVNDHLWQGFWDVVFVVANFLLAGLFGVVGGTLLRGVPVDAQGDFSLALFTNFKVHGEVGLLDWYTVSVSIFAAIIMGAHGATYLWSRTKDQVHDRCEFFATRLWIAGAALLPIIIFETTVVRPGLLLHALENPLIYLGVAMAFAGAGLLFTGLSGQNETRAHGASNLLVASLLATIAAALFPVMLYSTLVPKYSMTACSTASSPHDLLLALCWWPVTFVLAVAYSVFIARHFSGKVDTLRDNQGFPDSSP